MPRVRQYDHELARVRTCDKLVRRCDRVEKQQPVAVVDRIRRDDPWPFAVVPFRMWRLPVPHIWGNLVHGAILRATLLNERGSDGRSLAWAGVPE